MSKPAENLPDDPAVLKAMIAVLQEENVKISATLRVHDQLVQALRLRIAKLQKLAFGKSSGKIEREIEQLELALEDLLVAVAEDDDAPINEGQDEPLPEAADAPALRRRPRVSDATPRERRELDPGACCPDCGGDLRVVGDDVSSTLPWPPGCDSVTVLHKPRLLSDNGPCYISGDLAKYIEKNGMDHVRGAPNHPQTQGKIKR